MPTPAHLRRRRGWTPSRSVAWWVSAAVGGLWGLLVAHGALAEERVVLDTVAEGRRLVLELDAADIHVFLEGEGGALVHATAATTATTTESPGPTELILGHVRGEAVLTRRLPEGSEGPRLRLDLLVPPEMPMRIAGRDLSIRIEPAAYTDRGEESLADAGGRELTEDAEGSGGTPEGIDEERDQKANTPQGDASNGRDHPDDPPWLDLDLESSELMAHGITDIGGRVSRSHLDFEKTHHALELALTESFTEIEDHQGSLALRIIGGETSVAGGRGSHEIWAAAHAEIEVSEGLGRLFTQVTAESRLRIDGFRGDVSVEGAQSFVEGRRLWSAGKGVKIEAERLDLVLEDCRGPFEAQLKGGRLNGVAFLGQAKITGLRQAEIELEDLNGQLALWLRTGSSGQVAETRGKIEANVDGSRLTVWDAQRLDLTAKDAEVELRGLRALAGFRAQGSRLDLDLRSLQGNKPVLHLLSQTRGAIRVAAPCMVQIKSTDPLGASNVEVSGCETKRHGEGNRRRAPTRIDGSRMTWLTVDIAPDAQIEIDGY